MSKKIIIVGGVAGGASAAARLRRLDDQAEIVLLERGPDISFANCGLPYHIGGEIRRRRQLILKTPADLQRRFGLDIRTRHEARAIDRHARTVTIRDYAEQRDYEEHYDYIVLAPGAAPVRPPLPGIDHPRIHTLRNLADTDAIKRSLADDARTALVVGGGFIGLELVENFRRRDLDVTLVERLPQVMPPFDSEMTTPLLDELHRNQVTVHLGTSVERFDDRDGRIVATLDSGAQVAADLVALTVGVLPDSGLAQAAGLDVDPQGRIIVDSHMRSSDPHIYAVGDAVLVRDAVLPGSTWIPLAGPANRQGRIAADNIAGRDATYRGSQGTSIVRVFERTAAATGVAEKTLAQRGVPYHKIYLMPGHHVGYYPGAEPILVKLLFAPEDGQVLGAQIVGAAGVDKRIDLFALAVQMRLTVHDLAEAELAYAPPFGAAKDPVNFAGFIAGNLLAGDVEFVYPEQLDDNATQRWTLLDVRDETELLTQRYPGALWIPLPKLRERYQEIPVDKPVVTLCATGHRSYYACRMLKQRGYQALSLAGGLYLHHCVTRSDETACPICSQTPNSPS